MSTEQDTLIIQPNGRLLYVTESTESRVRELMDHLRALEADERDRLVVMAGVRIIDLRKDVE